MPTQYRLVLDEPAQDVLLSLPSAERRALVDFLRGLADHPFRTSGQQVCDSDGRRNEVELFGRLVITYWADHAVAQLRVVALEFF